MTAGNIAAGIDVIPAGCASRQKSAMAEAFWVAWLDALTDRRSGFREWGAGSSVSRKGRGRSGIVDKIPRLDKFPCRYREYRSACGIRHLPPPQLLPMSDV